MVKLFIDNIECDFDDSLSLTLSYNGDDMVNLESGRTGSRLSFRLPTTEVNSAIFGGAGDIHAESKFNTQWHAMSVERDGVTLFSGTAYLMGVVWSGAERYFSVECGGGVLAWAESAAQTLFKNINISYSNTLNESNVKESWADDSDVKFFPIVRDSYDDEGSSVDVTGVRLLRSIDDYHPFIRVSALIKAIFDSSGYSLESETSESELFDELYISGDYSSAENSAAREAMGFYAKRNDDTTTTTDSFGRVSMSPYDIASTVGNIVDIETTLSDSECYNYGGVLQIDDEALTFVPLTQISAGFEYYLHYTCVCQIESRQKLKGIDTLDTISNGMISWEITNRHEDQQESIVLGIDYKLVIFDFEAGDRYLLTGIDSSYNATQICYITERVSEISFSQDFAYFELSKYNSVGYQPCSEDWALYFGYVEEYEPVEVKITVRSSPTDYSPLSPMIFESQLFRGADAGVEFTLHKDSSLRPYFSEYPGYNSQIGFEDIAKLSYSALDFLGALQHLFNLRFSTNDEAKVVTIESFDKFYNGELRDWSDKLLLSEGIEFVDLAHSTHRSNTYGYQQTDGVVQRLGESDNESFGEWTFAVDSYAASSSSQTTLNPIFSASTNDEDGVLVVGDRDDLTTIDSLSFSTRIARYLGMVDVEGENYSLPYVSFHAPESGFTLCFEDRDGVAGLNRHYLSYADLLRRSQYISLSLQLSALDYANLFAPNSQSASIRDKFYFEIYGESFKTILHSIESYDLSSGVARCLFLTID